MSNGKWLADVAPDEPVSSAARKAVRTRLKHVEINSRLAAHKADQDIEHVHQERVSTRRAQAALQIFADLIPKRRRQRVERQLKRLRRTAGQARDLDVLCERLIHKESYSESGALNGIVEDIRRQRKRAQKPLVREWKRMKQDQFGRRSSELVKRIRWRGKGKEPSYHRAAVARLRPAVDAFFAAGEADLTITDNLHELRIVGKKLRYSIELLSPGISPVLRTEIYPVFAEIQESLGEINDHIVAKELFERWLVQTNDRRTIADVAQLIADEREAYLSARHRFASWWNPDNVSGLKRQFDQILDESDGAAQDAIPSNGRANVRDPHVPRERRLELPKPAGAPGQH